MLELGIKQTTTLFSQINWFSACFYRKLYMFVYFEMDKIPNVYKLTRS